MKFNLKIATPERIVLQEQVDQVSIPTTTGEITVLPNHLPLITQISSGDIVAIIDGEHVPMAVVGGVAHVTGDAVVVLADFADHVSDLSDDLIQKAKQRAQELMSEKEKVSKEDFEHFEAELERSLTRVKIADKWAGKKYRNLGGKIG